MVDEKQTGSVLNGLCPFRGGNWCKLDERCPAAVEVTMGEAMDSSRELVLVPIPVLRTGTYCRTCVDDTVREKETGRGVRKERGSGAGVLRGGRRRRG